MSFENAEKEQQVRQVVVEAIAELNLQRGADERLSDDGEAGLFGSGGPLDSLGLVQLIAELENAVEDRWGIRLDLADEALLEAEDSPFAKVGTLQAYLLERV